MCGTLINIYAIRWSAANTVYIAQEPRQCLALEPFLVKNRAAFSVHAGLWDFGAKI